MGVSIKDVSKDGSKIKVKTKKLRKMGSLSIDEMQLPAVKDWTVGEEYEIVIKVRQTGVREVDSWDIEEYGYKEGDVRAEFEIISARTPDTKS